MLLLGVKLLTVVGCARYEGEAGWHDAAVVHRQDEGNVCGVVPVVLLARGAVVPGLLLCALLLDVKTPLSPPSLHPPTSPLFPLYPPFSPLFPPPHALFSSPQGYRDAQVAFLDVPAVATAPLLPSPSSSAAHGALLPRQLSLCLAIFAPKREVVEVRQRSASIFD